VAAASYLAAEFLADDGVIGKALLNETPEQLLRGPIRHRDRRLIGLALHDDASLIMRQREAASLPGGVNRKVEEGLHRVHP
jgi:hypothetical protein